MGRLDGKVALVTGASANNGGTAAHYMAKEGAKIVANDLVPEAAEETAQFLRSRGYDAVAIPGDGSDMDQVQETVKQALAHFGKIDILLNMVGRQFRWSVLDVNIHDWNRQLTGYLTGAMLNTKYVARSMVDRGIKGSIVHIASDAAWQGEAGNSGYSAAKAGVVNFSRAAAMDLAQYGIRVNTISPTYIEHNLWRFGLMGVLRTPLRVTSDDFLQGIPLGRFCRATDLAHTAVFLASDEASFITGVDIPLDGGARAKYWPWQPGAYTGITVEEYAKTVKRMRYGEPVEEEETA